VLQTTDGRATAYSEREHKFTFAKKVNRGETLPQFAGFVYLVCF